MRGRRSDLPDGLRQAGTTNDGRDEYSKRMRITTHCHGLYPRLQVHARPPKTTILNTSPSPCGSTIGGDSSNITIRPILKIGIQPRHRRLHRRFAAIRRSLHSQKNARHRPQTAERAEHAKTKRTGVFGRTNTDIAISSGHPDNDPPSPRRGGSAVRKNGTIAIRKPMTPQYHSHECRRFIFGRKRYRNLHESPKRTTTPASRDESEIEPEIKGFRLSVGHRHTAIRSTAPRDLHAAGPPRNPPYGAIPAPAAIPARPRNNIPRLHAQKNSGRMKRKYQKRQPTA